MAGKPLSIGLILFCQVSAMTLWFSATAAATALVADGTLSGQQAGLLTGAVQLGFVAGTLLSALTGMADRFDPPAAVRRLGHRRGRGQCAFAGHGLRRRGDRGAALCHRHDAGRGLSRGHEDGRGLDAEGHGADDRRAGGCADAGIVAAAPVQRGGRAGLAHHDRHLQPLRGQRGGCDPVLGVSARICAAPPAFACPRPGRPCCASRCCWRMPDILAICGSFTPCGPGSACSWNGR